MPIERTLAGIVISLSPAPRKAHAPMVSKDSGRVIESNALQLSKAYSLIVFTSPAKETSDKFVQ